MNDDRKIYVINNQTLEKLEEAIADLQCIFLDIFSNREIEFQEDKTDARERD